ncbi:MAG: hypothetical protein ACE5DI_01240 [Candidatus Micrarchaeia archaeon]
MDLKNEFESKDRDFEWQYIRHLVDTYEDMQKVRLAEMNRARQLLYRRLEDLGYAVEEKKLEGEKAFGEKVSDKVLKPALEKAIKEGKLSEQEVELIEENSKYGKKFKALEAEIQKRFSPRISTHPVYVNYLSKFKGVGVLTSARLICFLGDCYNGGNEEHEKDRFPTVSKLWAYAGYSVDDGRAQRRKKGQKSNWNNRLKTLGFLIGDSFIKQRSKYREIYDAERKRLRELHPEKIKVDGKTKYNDGHVHAMARRNMVKKFFCNYWIWVRKFYGFPVREPFVVEKLGHSSFRSPESFFDEDLKKAKKRGKKKKKALKK